MFETIGMIVVAIFVVLSAVTAVSSIVAAIMILWDEGDAMAVALCVWLAILATVASVSVYCNAPDGAHQQATTMKAAGGDK